MYLVVRYGALFTHCQPILDVYDIERSRLHIRGSLSEAWTGLHHRDLSYKRLVTLRFSNVFAIFLRTSNFPGSMYHGSREERVKKFRKNGGLLFLQSSGEEVPA